MIKLIDDIKKAIRGRINGGSPWLPKVTMEKKLKLSKIRIIRADGTVEERTIK